MANKIDDVFMVTEHKGLLIAYKKAKIGRIRTEVKTCVGTIIFKPFLFKGVKIKIIDEVTI